MAAEHPYLDPALSPEQRTDDLHKSGQTLFRLPRWV